VNAAADRIPAVPTAPGPLRRFGPFDAAAIVIGRSRTPRFPGFFVACSFLMVANEVWQNPVPSLTGLAVIATGLPVYLAVARRRARPEAVIAS